ncbi:hypothetical protein [Pectobacterium aroidearum]|uniref:hypothetical protein n=1 Tax=Pectobacterium aroidearum TaxID=1201031 RepID=UPI0032EC437D
MIFILLIYLKYKNQLQMEIIELRNTSWIFKFICYSTLALSLFFLWKWIELSNQQNRDLVETISNGIISGIVTSLIVVIFSFLWRSNITPWLENTLYKDTKVEGIWEGMLIPYIGIDQIDKRRQKIVMGIISKRKMGSDVNSKTEIKKETGVSALLIDSKGKEEKVDAELILKNDGNDREESNHESSTIKISIAVVPIEIRAEIKRSGHTITANIIEIGGASQIHTYSVKGSFKNLIFTGEYENDDPSNIDRGSLSLMLIKNGRVFEGFFSSYADNENKMHPFKCILQRQKK